MKTSVPQQIASQLFLCAVLIWYEIQTCNGHGRLIEPPSRASAWRYGFQTPPDYNDHELYCGGFTRQWRRNDGKCGECGDPWDAPEPRPHEHGGLWGIGVIVRYYSPGSEMAIRVELTASHMGYFEFRVCEHARAKQDCLDKHLLRILGGSPAVPSFADLETRFYPRNGSRIYEIKARLPELECSHCVLQWRYIAGNNWGMCPNGVGAVGCGPQEEFRACADIALLTNNVLSTPIRPVRPKIRTTQRPNLAYTSTSTEATQRNDTEAFNYHSLLISIFLVIFFFVICFGVYYLHQKKSDRIKQMHAWLLQNVNNRFCKKETTTKSMLTTTTTATTAKTNTATIPTKSILEATDNQNGNKSTLPALPIAPPRAKRLTRVKCLQPEEFCVA